MRFRTAILLCVVLVISLATAAQTKPTSNSATAGGSASKYVPVHEYDPKRDPAKDVKDAIAEATLRNKRILVEVGGKWCSWCAYMDKFFEQNATMRDFRDSNFVTLKINWSPENKNEKFLSKYPKIGGYPHIFVLEKDGKLLHSQDSSQLEQAKGYSMQAMAKFLQEWSPTKQ